MKVAILGRGMVGMIMANELSRRANIECEIITPDSFPSSQVWQVKTMSQEKCTGRKSDRKRNRANRWR